MKTLICDCNRTMPLDGPALSRTLARTPGASPDGLDTVHTLLCRREAGAFQRAARDGGELLVACTQESRLFAELAAETEGVPALDERPIRFVNIRETGGWSRDARGATPKIAALIAAAQLPDPAPVATVGYTSAGRTLVIGAAGAAERAAHALADALDVELLVDRHGGALEQAHRLPVHTGRLSALHGWLGAFDAQWDSGNPIDLDLCTRCNACVEACPEQAIDWSYQVDLSRCTNHRDCVRVCDAAGAIDFQRAPVAHAERYDLVLDLRAEPAFAQHQKPQGYFHAPDEASLFAALPRLREMRGEFEKPRFFRQQPALCAHSRNRLEGCRACIDVCSAQAIRSDAVKGGSGGVVVEPHLCVGCGACGTVCPTGALSFAYPGAVDQGKRLRTVLQAYQAGGGRDAALLLHSQEAGSRLIDALGREARSGRGRQGVPARVLPLPVWHTASVGLDLWLAAIAQGASQVWVLLTDEEAPEYRKALGEQMEIGQALLTGLGYRGTHLRVVEAADTAELDALLAAPAAQAVEKAAAIAVQADKRNTLEWAVDHLALHAPAPVDEIPLPAGSPFGSLAIDTAACTLCLSCVGACPSKALADNAERPQLNFIEKNCVQCGLCVGTCPESALSLVPRLLLADGGRARKQARVLHEAEPFRCIRCSKPFGTLRAIEQMVAKLSSHAAFQGAAADRLRMCGDCRVNDMFSNRQEMRITDL